MNKFSPTVSVIIPTFNRSDFLREAIESVLNQTSSEFELIVVDDGSTDSTPSVVSSFNDSRLNYLQQENRGVSAARNRGVKNSSAPYVAFLDSDDLWFSKKLEVQLAFVNSGEEVHICQTEEIWIRNGKRVNPMTKHKKHSGWIFKECLPLCIVSPSAVMMKREVFEMLGGFDENLPACEDYDLWLRASLRYPIHTLADALTVKRGGHDDQLSKRWGLDRYRIVALEKLFSDSLLSDENKRLVLDKIVERSTIVADGAKKRNRLDVFDEHSAKVSWARSIANSI